MKNLLYALGGMCFGMVMAPAMCHAGPIPKDGLSAPSPDQEVVSRLLKPLPQEEVEEDAAMDELLALTSEWFDNASWLFVHNALVYWMIFTGCVQGHWTGLLGTQWGTNTDWFPCCLTYVILPCFVALLGAFVTAYVRLTYGDGDDQEDVDPPTLRELFVAYAVPTLLSVGCQAWFFYEANSNYPTLQSLAIARGGEQNSLLFTLVYPWVVCYGVIIPIWMYVMQDYVTLPTISSKKRKYSFFVQWGACSHRMLVYNMLTHIVILIFGDILDIRYTYVLQFIPVMGTLLITFGEVGYAYLYAKSKKVRNDALKKFWLDGGRAFVSTALTCFFVFALERRSITIQGVGTAWAWVRNAWFGLYRCSLFHFVYPMSIACFVCAPLFVYLERYLFPEAEEVAVPTSEGPKDVKGDVGLAPR